MLKHDNHGFLVGERLAADDITGRLDAIRNEVAALRRDIGGSNASPVARPRQVERVEAGPEHAAGSPSSEPGAVSSEARRNEVVIRIDRPAVAATPPDRQAPGRYVYRAAQAAGSEGEASAASPSRPASQAEPGPATSQPVARATARPATPSPGAGRDAGGRFVRRSEAASPGGRQRGDGSPRDDDEDGGRLSTAIDGMGRRLGDALQEVGTGTEEADPAVKAFNEVAQPLSRGFSKIMGGDSDRNQERWYRRFWRMMRRKNRDDEQEGKRQRRILKNIERKPVSDGGGSMLWRGVLLLLAPITAMLSLLGALPLAIAGALASSLKWLLTAMGMGSMARRIPVPGAGRRAGGRHAPRTAAPPPAAAAGQGGRQSRAAGAVPPGAGSSPPGSGGRIGGALRQGARRIPGIGALLGLGFMASDVAASERSDASREEKNVTTGRAVGGGLGGIGGMAGGAAAGAALGSVVPVIGTAVGGVVGAIAGGFFGGSAGEVLGEKAGQWLNRLQDTPIIQGMSDSWHYAADFTSILWGDVSDAVAEKWEQVTNRWESISSTVREGWDKAASAITERWKSVTDDMKARWQSAVELAARSWEALTSALGGVNDWIRDKTGIDIGQSASDAANWISDTAVSSAQWTADRASDAAGWISERAGQAADSVSGAASTAWDGVKDAGSWVADTTGLSSAAAWLSGAAREAGERREERRSRDERWQSARDDLVGASVHAGVDPGLVAQIASFESGFNSNAAPISSDASRNRVRQHDGRMAMSSAHGYGQFIDATWTDALNRHGAKYGIEGAGSLSPEQAAELRSNPAIQAAMLAEFTRENVEKGRRLGGSDDAANAYAFHNLGDGDASRLLSGMREGMTVREALTQGLGERGRARVEQVIANNPSLYRDGNISAAEAYAAMGEHMRAGNAYAADARQRATVMLAQGSEPAAPASPTAPGVEPTVSTAHLAPMGLAANGPPAGVTPPPAAHVPAPSMPRVAEAPTVSAPLSPPSSHDGDRRHGGQGQDVSRDVSDRRIAHIVTGAYSGMS
ncbi:hypothetical protein [Halomonas salipaludis]|uniref:Phage tail lysozyme domain-containing protein n=1 Tax=Halomonas salipaludis TaxID=2032625 RepID=A0A2A2F1D8_9GAMM|nr:hypothetical protein [Halomonas salipaludis]PAU79246.1 hypothetical protein CK498_02425 [Halomonas salipaludis]